MDLTTCYLLNADHIHEKLIIDCAFCHTSIATEVLHVDLELFFYFVLLLLLLLLLFCTTVINFEPLTVLNWLYLNI